MFPALLQIARPYDESTLCVRRRYRKLTGALVSPVKAMDKRSCHLWIEFKIEVAHHGSPSTVWYPVRLARLEELKLKGRPALLKPGQAIASLRFNARWRYSQKVFSRRVLVGAVFPPDIGKST